MEDGELASLQDIIKVKLHDEEGQHIGHVEDLALEKDLSSPYVAYLGAHIMWSDRVGNIELVKPAEDIIFLIPWTQLESFSEDSFHLRGIHPRFPVETARGKLLLRRDLLNKQMLDSRGNRIQRVDDVFIEKEGQRLKVIGLEVSRGLLLSSSTIRDFVERLKSQYGLKRLDFRDSVIHIKRGELIYMAVVLSGEEPEDLDDSLGETIDRMESKYKEILENWDGDIDSLRGLKDMLEEILD